MKGSEAVRITKIDAARRQLITAIRLFFDGGDRVSVYTLASNAWEVVDALCVNAGIESASEQTRGNLPAGHTLKYYINEPCRNFFKHAARDDDPDAAVELRESEVAAILFLAVEDYIRLRQSSPIEVQVFQAWYIAVHPEKVADNSAARATLEGARSAFFGIEKLSSSEQAAFGMRVLGKACGVARLTSDPRSEPGF